MSLTNDIGQFAPHDLDLARRLAACNDDERAVLKAVLLQALAGIEKGHGIYGHMDLARDTRDLDAEGDDEARDFVIYRAMRSVQRARLAAAQEGTLR